MKKYFLFLSSFCFALSAFGQQSKIEIASNPLLSASNYLAYPVPVKKLTAAPEGYKPFYISHYGRHGSRYLIGRRDYDRPYQVLLHADSLGKLTAKGKDVLRKLSVVSSEALGRDGEVTLLDALQQLLVLNPDLDIRHDASYHDMYYMNQSDKALERLRKSDDVKHLYKSFVISHSHFGHLMRVLFNDEVYWKNSVDASSLNGDLFQLAGNMQSLDSRDSISFYDLFSKDEIYDNWLIDNARWYLSDGSSPFTGGKQPYSQRNLLYKMISEADSCIALPQPGATLRYGHDTMVLPLTCLLDFNGYGKQISDLEQLDDEGWCDYKIFPMACNIQFVFYRRNYGDKDVLFKVLLNENEATLPIKTDKAPYYHWSDFKAYFLQKLAGYHSV